jgi:hypothetical protein
MLDINLLALAIGKSSVEIPPCGLGKLLAAIVRDDPQ